MEDASHWLVSSREEASELLIGANTLGIVLRHLVFIRLRLVIRAVLRVLGFVIEKHRREL